MAADNGHVYPATFQPGGEERRSLYGWVVLAVIFVIMVLGYAIRNSFSVFYPTIIEEFGWERGSTALMFSIALLVYGSMAPVAGSLVDRFQPKFVIAAGACITGAGIALCSLATTQWQLYLFYGIMSAAGLSLMGFTPLVTIISSWFVTNRGLVFGIMNAGFGTSLISASIVQLLISHYGWQTSYVIIGIFSAAVIIPLSLIFIRRHPQKEEHPARTEQQPTSGPEDTNPTHKTGSLASSWAGVDWTVRRAMKTYQFWFLILTCFCHQGFAEQIAIAHQVYFYRDAGYEPMQAATFYSVFGIAFVAGNLGGHFSDRFGRERVYIPGCLLGAGAACLLLLIQDTSQPWMPFLTAVCLGLGLGATVPTFFAAVADLFQGRHLGMIQGSMIMSFSAGGAISPWLAGFLHDRTGSYHVAFYIVLASLLTAAVLMWLVAPRKLSPVHGKAKGHSP
ncbi:MAG: MFS transporter, partial [Dehalococcoidia bacterium]|nr:MFS transporter [Dehalococcoidia bacterium]